MESRDVYRLASAPVTCEIRPIISTHHMNASVHKTAFLGFPVFLSTLQRNLGARPSKESPNIALTVP